MIGFMESQHESIAEQDPFWDLEHRQLEELGSDGGGKLVEKALMKCLPASSANLWNVARSLASLKRIFAVCVCACLHDPFVPSAEVPLSVCRCGGMLVLNRVTQMVTNSKRECR